MSLIYQVPPVASLLFPRDGFVQNLKTQPFPTAPHRVCLEDSLFEILESYRQSSGKNEAGGVLLGRRTTFEIRVETATQPGPGDKAGRTFFERHPQRVQQLINEAWKASNGRQNYLGEWHTHPEPFPLPSRRDRAMIRQMFREAQPRISPLLLLILGTEGIWLGCQTRHRLEQLRLRLD